jgi:NAD(P)-dependent dehydrogenase (short-subunit alcohol dehydrogenase family)
VADLSGRRALVTGANRGIGLEVVRSLGDLGMRVFLGSRDPDAGVAAAAQLGQLDVSVVRLDVADPTSVTAALDAIGPDGVDVVVNNAAINPRDDVSAAVVEAAWQINVLGAWRVSRAFLPPMVERGWGRIVNVTSEAASHAHQGRSGIYALTKIALNVMTRAQAEDLAGSGVLVNACSPGWCRSDMGGRQAPRSAEQGAASIVWGATLPDDGPTGAYVQDGEPLPW